ncbi:MAG: imelysin family protein [Polyangiaceae bacterium]
MYTGRDDGAAPPTSPVPTALPPVDVPPPPDDAFTKERLLTAIATCALGRFEAFEVEAKVLESAATAHDAAPDAVTQSAVEEAWRRAMDVWQEAELFRVGPAAHAGEPGGQDLRDVVYAFPSVSRCRIEEQLVAKSYADASFGSSLVNGRGLGALEYLLFFPGDDNDCSRFSPINGTTGVTWTSLGAPERATRKRSYAAAVARDVRNAAGRLVAAWSPAGGDFVGELARAGSGSRTFATQQAAFDALTMALFYVEKETKDLKLGRPLGYVECTTGSTCPEAVESRFARTSTAHVRANYRGFRRLFQGCGENGAGFGFDDWLVAVGAGDLATRMIAALRGAEIALDAIDVPLDDAIRTTPDRVAAAHAALRALTDPLKTEFVSILDLELPKASEGDND